MKKRKEILSQINELESGIIPFFVWFKKSDAGFITGVNEKRWAGIDSNDSIKMKRKFRKLYRKACKKYGIISDISLILYCLSVISKGNLMSISTKRAFPFSLSCASVKYSF